MDLVFFAIATILCCLNPIFASDECSVGQQCILLDSCPSIIFNPSSPSDRERVKSLICAWDEDDRAKVCCDVSSPPVTKPVKPPSTGDLVQIIKGDPDDYWKLTPSEAIAQAKLLPEDQCGSSLSGRVFGGQELPIDTFMWMALLDYGTELNPQWGCGGSLITNRYVLTAAHCVDRLYTGHREISRVRLGEHYLDRKKDCQRLNNGQDICARQPVQDFTPKEIIIHSGWNKETVFSNDIALIRLDREADLSGFVQPICLPPSGLDISTFLNGRKAQAAGWGETKTIRRSNVKLMVEIPYVPLETCKQQNRNNKGEITPLLNKGQVCFGGEEGEDTCRGDSGGAVVSTDNDSESSNLYIQLGIVSYGRGCGNPQPAVYTDVSQYRQWIITFLKP